MRVLFVALLMMSLALAGCASDPEDDPTPTSSSTSTSRTSTTTSSAPPVTTSSSTTTSQAPAPNRAPTGSLSAFVNGTNVLFNLTGNDIDGDSLSWTLAFGDGNNTQGTALPTSIPHNYTVPGNVSIVFTLSDGEASNQYRLNLSLVAGSLPVQRVTVKWTVGTAWCVEYPYGAQSQADGSPTPFMHGTAAANVLYGELAVDPAWIGRPYVANFGKPASPLDAGIVAFYDADDAYLDLGGSAGGLNGPPEVAADPMVATGVVPVGAAWATFMNCANPQGISVEFTV